MIKFFRNIRKKLLRENRVSKYLVYALGEIVLVVIGILIALQINNWNEWKKERKKEEKILMQVKNNISDSIERWERLLSISDDICKSYDIVVEAKQHNLPFQDTLQEHFRRASWIAYNWSTGHSTSSFEALKNMGFDIIQNDSLSNLIIEVFDNHIVRVQRQYELEHTNSPYNEYLATNVRALIEDFNNTNYVKLLKDDHYYSILQVRDAFRKLHMDFIKNYHLPPMRQAAEIIDKELAKL